MDISLLHTGCHPLGTSTCLEHPEEHLSWGFQQGDQNPLGFVTIFASPEQTAIYLLVHFQGNQLPGVLGTLPSRERVKPWDEPGDQHTKTPVWFYSHGRRRRCTAATGSRAPTSAKSGLQPVPVALGCCPPARQEPQNHQLGHRGAAGIGGTATSPRLLQKPCGGRALQGARPKPSQHWEGEINKTLGPEAGRPGTRTEEGRGELLALPSVPQLLFNSQSGARRC